jgi:hypothetical protein
MVVGFLDVTELEVCIRELSAHTYLLEIVYEKG